MSIPFSIGNMQQINALWQIVKTDLFSTLNMLQQTAYGIIDLHLIRFKAFDMHPVSSGIGINEY